MQAMARSNLPNYESRNPKTSFKCFFLLLLTRENIATVPRSCFPNLVFEAWRASSLISRHPFSKVVRLRMHHAIYTTIIDKSLGTNKFALVALFHTRQINTHARIQLHLLSPSPHSNYNVGHTFNTVVGGGVGGGGWGGGQKRIFKRITVLFSTPF